MEGRIKRLEREWDHPANPGPDPEAVAEWARLWIEAGMEEPRAMAEALEFLIHCQSTGERPTIAALNKWAHAGSNDRSFVGLQAIHPHARGDDIR